MELPSAHLLSVSYTHLGEDPVTANTAQGITYHYSPVGDVLQIFLNGVELANGSAVPVQVLSDNVLFEVSVNRTTVLG